MVDPYAQSDATASMGLQKRTPICEQVPDLRKSCTNIIWVGRMVCKKTTAGLAWGCDCGELEHAHAKCRLY